MKNKVPNIKRVRPECLECMYYDKRNRRHFYYCWLISCLFYKNKTWKETITSVLKIICFFPVRRQESLYKEDKSYESYPVKQ